MACVLLVKKDKIKDGMKWFNEVMEIDSPWEKDLVLKGYKNGSIYFVEFEDFYRFEDFSNEYFAYWEMESWFLVAGEHEIMYGYYSEDELAAEFIHIKDGECIREYKTYYDMPEDNVDEGDLPEFEDWVDVSAYVDSKMG